MQDFESVYLAYYDTVFRFIRSLCRDETLAEEVTQEVFFRVLKAIPKFRGECRLDVWICQIAKHTLYDISVKRRRSQSMEGDKATPTDDVSAALILREDAQRAHTALHKLPEPYREVFWMRVFGEMSFAEIAALFEKTESWARVTYHRARIKLQEGLK